MELFIAAGISIVVQLVKKMFGTSTLYTLGVLFGLSLVAGWLMWALQYYGFWETFVQVATMSAGVWALVIRQIEKMPKSEE